MGVDWNRNLIPSCYSECEVDELRRFRGRQQQDCKAEDGDVECPVERPQPCTKRQVVIDCCGFGKRRKAFVCHDNKREEDQSCTAKDGKSGEGGELEVEENDLLDADEEIIEAVCPEDHPAEEDKCLRDENFRQKSRVGCKEFTCSPDLFLTDEVAVEKEKYAVIVASPEDKGPCGSVPEPQITLEARRFA